MKLLLDTHILLWAATEPKRLPIDVRLSIADPNVEPLFSSASIWEIVIKRGLGRDDFQIDPNVFRRRMLDNGYAELPIKSEHALAVGRLPPIHKDPFDRILIAQATAEGVTLLTADPVIAQYPGPIVKVK